MHALTASRVACWSRCPRQHHYRYELGARPVSEDAEALRFGTRIHAGLEAWWSAYQHGDAERALSAALRAADCETLADFDAARASAMLREYDAQWCAWAATVHVIAVEATFATPLRDELGNAAKTWELAGKIDALIELPDGRVAILEHKTASGDVGEGSDYRRKLALDGQVSMYFHGAASLLGGRSVDVCIYDILVKPGCKPALATPPEARKFTKEGKLYASQREADETPEAYAERCAAEVDLVQVEVLRSDSELATHMADLWDTVHAIEATRRRQSAGARHTTACFDWHRACDYLEVCEGRASIDDSIRYRRLPIHQELSR